MFKHLIKDPGLYYNFFQGPRKCHAIRRKWSSILWNLGGVRGGGDFLRLVRYLWGNWQSGFRKLCYLYEDQDYIILEVDLFLTIGKENIPKKKIILILIIKTLKLALLSFLYEFSQCM